MTDTNAGRFVWYDLLTNDPAAAIAFYTYVIGWTTTPLQEVYTLFVGSRGPLAGTTALPEALAAAGAKPYWAASVKVADVDAVVAQARELGGRVISEPKDYPNIGRLAVIGDPQGASMHVFAPGAPMTIHASSVPGEFDWHELMTTDHEAAFAFYSALFGWKKVSDFDMGQMGKYLIYGAGGVELGGMFTKPPGAPMPTLWLYYVNVGDLEAAVERAKDKGGQLLNGPMDVPGGGRIAQLLDPQGVAFALHWAAPSGS